MKQPGFNKKLFVIFVVTLFLIVKLDSVFAVHSSQYSNLRWWTATVVEHNSHADIDIQYPQFIGGREVVGLNAYISGLVLERLYSDREAIRQWMDIEAGILPKGTKSEYWGDDSWEYFEGCGSDWASDEEYYYICSVNLTIAYRVTAIINDIVSIEMIFTDFTGGGSGNHNKAIVVNYDLKTDRPLKAENLFCNRNYFNVLPIIISEYSKTPDFNWRDVFRGIIFEGSDSQVAEAEESAREWALRIMQTVSPIPQGFENIILGYRGLSFVFDPYVLGSGAQGIARIPVVYNLLNKILCLP